LALDADTRIRSGFFARERLCRDCSRGRKAATRGEHIGTGGAWAAPAAGDLFLRATLPATLPAPPLLLNSAASRTLWCLRFLERCAVRATRAIWRGGFINMVCCYFAPSCALLAALHCRTAYSITCCLAHARLLPRLPSRCILGDNCFLTTRAPTTLCRLALSGAMIMPVLCCISIVSPGFVTTLKPVRALSCSSLCCFHATAAHCKRDIRARRALQTRPAAACLLPWRAVPAASHIPPPLPLQGAALLARLGMGVGQGPLPGVAAAARCAYRACRPLPFRKHRRRQRRAGRTFSHRAWVMPGTDGFSSPFLPGAGQNACAAAGNCLSATTFCAALLALYRLCAPCGAHAAAGGQYLRFRVYGRMFKTRWRVPAAPRVDWMVACGFSPLVLARDGFHARSPSSQREGRRFR